MHDNHGPGVKHHEHRRRFVIPVLQAGIRRGIKALGIALIASLLVGGPSAATHAAGSDYYASMHAGGLSCLEVKHRDAKMALANVVFTTEDDRTSRTNKTFVKTEDPYAGHTWYQARIYVGLPLRVRFLKNGNLKIGFEGWWIVKHVHKRTYQRLC